MGRVRAKGKKLSVGNQEDGNDEEVKVAAQKRRGRPQKSLKEDEVDEDESQKVEDEYSEDSTGLQNKTGKKQRMNEQLREKVYSLKEENGNGTKLTSEEMKISNGFRSNGNRRKNKPRRAAEAVVECN